MATTKQKAIAIFAGISAIVIGINYANPYSGYMVIAGILMVIFHPYLAEFVQDGDSKKSSSSEAPPPPVWPMGDVPYYQCPRCNCDLILKLSGHPAHGDDVYHQMCPECHEFYYYVK